MIQHDRCTFCFLMQYILAYWLARELNMKPRYIESFTHINFLKEGLAPGKSFPGPITSALSAPCVWPARVVFRGENSGARFLSALLDEWASKPLMRPVIRREIIPDREEVEARIPSLWYEIPNIWVKRRCYCTWLICASSAPPFPSV